MNQSQIDLQGAKILVVDDVPENLSVLRKTLEPQGYRIWLAPSGEIALKIAQHQRPDLILLDVMMPGIDGFETCRQLKQDGETQDTPVLFITARDDTKDVLKGFAVGGVDYITKPFQDEVVLARVKTHLRNSKMARILAQEKKDLEIMVEAITEHSDAISEALNRKAEFIRETFGRYISDDVVAGLLDSPEALELGGEKRKVTILMSDLRGFTGLSERLDPQQVFAYLNHYLKTMIDIILEYNGTIIEILGDGIMVIFGAPIQRSDDAQRAVACAVSMQLAMGDIDDSNRRSGLPEVEMGIGIHTGEVVVGNIGSQQRTKYGAVGSAVNLTGRIESYTIGGQILISETTRQNAGGGLRIDRQLGVEPKGVREPITIHEVAGIGGDYNLFLHRVEGIFFTLPAEIPLRYTILEEKFAQRTVFDGTLVKLSIKGCQIRSEHAVPPLSNLKMLLIDANGEIIEGELYGKVIEPPAARDSIFSVRFTSMSKDITTFWERLIADCSATVG